MPITRVLDARGNVMHDCVELGCEVSWDGVALVKQPTVDQPADAATLATPATPALAGEPVAGASPIGPYWVAVDDHTVRYSPPDDAA